MLITVVIPSDDVEHVAPGGFHYVSQMFAEAGLRDGLGETGADTTWQRLRVLRRGLQRELKRPVVLRIVSPWTIGGLWLVVRYRLRNFPCLLIGDSAYALETPLDDLLEAARRSLT